MVLMIIVIGSYVSQFYFNLGYVVSEKVADWVHFSNYVGGLISPLLSFISLILLIQSLNLQNRANQELRTEVKLNQKNEQLRSFETYFFGLIDAQRSAFAKFEIDFLNDTFAGVCAIRELEDQIEILRGYNVTEEDISQAIDSIDQKENIFNTIRIFYNIVKMVSEKLTNENGFDSKYRQNQFQTLIHFTEFSQLRLVMISMQFMDWESSKYLKKHEEFMAVLEELGGGANLY